MERGHKAVEALLRAHISSTGSRAKAKKTQQEREEKERQIQAEREENVKRKQLGESLYNASFYGNVPEVRRLLALGADARY